MIPKDFNGIDFYFCEKCHWDFDRISLSSIDSFGAYRHFNNINSSIP